MSLTGELWAVHAQNDIRNRELVQAPSGKRVTYDELLAEADPAIANQVNIPASRPAWMRSSAVSRRPSLTSSS